MKPKVITLKWDVLSGFEGLDDIRERLAMSGVYIWIFSGPPDRVAYIGESGNIGERHLTHFSFLVSGRYTAFAVPFGQDYLTFLDQHILGKSIDEIDPKKIVYPFGIHDKKGRFSFESFVSEERQKICHEYLCNLKFAMAEVPDRNDRVLAESLLLLGVKDGYRKTLKRSEVTMRGISPYSGKPARSDSTPFGRISRYPEKERQFEIIHTGKFRDALPREVLEVARYPEASDDAAVWKKAM